MSKIGEILINATRQKMEFHKRNASGTASQSLKEVPYSGGIRIMGVDYFDSIFNGIPAGQGVTKTTLIAWQSSRRKIYSDPNDWGISSQQAANNINDGDAWINSQQERLHIDKQVKKETKDSIDKEIRKHINKIIK